MKILLTGNRGMIGTKLRPHLDNCLCLDLVSGGNVITSDLPENIDVIYHLASQTSVESSWYDPVHDADNLRMTVRLVHKYPNAKLIFAQSGAIENPSGSPYAFSKWACGEYIKRFHNNYVICVFPNIYGVEGGKGVVDIFKGKDVVTIYGDGLQVRDFVHVDDIIKGLLEAQNWATGEYFMGSGKGTRVIDLAQGKTIIWEDARKEQRESILPNTTPNWEAKINVFDYLQ